MNGLALRISQAGGKKTKNSVGYAPLDVASYFTPNFPEDMVLSNFLKASSTDEQLTILKKCLETMKDSDIEAIKFLVIVFFHADAKHPVKCFLSRYITKHQSLQPSFSKILAHEIESSINHQHEYKKYMEVVSKIAMCIENFQSGANAVKMLDIVLMEFLKNCLQCCVSLLNITETLSPTEKNEIFNLAHLALRLLLHIVQKLDSPSDICEIFKDIRICLRELLFDSDVPMDTKSVCGILYLNMHLLENGSEYWVDIFEFPPKDDDIKLLLSNEACALSLYSSVATVISMERLQNKYIHGEVAVIVLCKKILDIGERSSSESIFILGVTRTLQQISKNLTFISNTEVGQSLVEYLLSFVWAHLEHYMDSVRHLTSQILGHIVRYCTKLNKEGETKALSSLFSKLNSLDRTRKSYYLSLTSLINELGAVAIIEALPEVVTDVIQALSIQAVQASATTTLETLLQKQALQSNTKTLFTQWIEPILSHVSLNSLDSGVLNVLENLLTKAVRLDENIMNYILPYIKQSSTSSYDLKCILMLLNVARKSGVANKLNYVENDAVEWKGVITYDLLKLAAVDACDETRILSLSLIAESPKSTEVFSRGELKLILYYLKYNINAQAPNFRQLTLSIMKKFIKRLNDSYKLHKKQSSDEYYIAFFEELRAFCFNCLLPGANYSRRFVALQLLTWCGDLQFDGYHEIWKPEYVEKLLLHLEDSYENNKGFALQILDRCPADIIQNNTYTISLRLEDIIKQASALKPTECVSASYKLSLLVNKLPHFILEGKTGTTTEQVSFVLLRRLQSVLIWDLAICKWSLIDACAIGPMYGILHCMRRIVVDIDADAISNDVEWRELLDRIIKDCISVNKAVACVVNNSSPEGHLPMDMTDAIFETHDGGVRLEDGRQVTAQMVLLCAWRSVKEVSLLLGEIALRLTIAGENNPEGTLSAKQMLLIGDHFTKLLSETKHRGAFEQAYVGFTKLLTRLWRCRSPELHELPRSWLDELMSAIASGEKKGTLCATRRSAGLPFMIQALVTTELQIQGNPKCFHQCMSTLLRLAHTKPESTRESETAIETRTHAINILRALFRNSMLEESVSGYVGEGLLVALLGFEGSTWMERNSSNLLFSALMVRIFGVQRSRDTEYLCTRNRMTGRIFFLRYPQLYDFMLEKLKEVSNSNDTQIIQPSLYPILLLLARLYPSSLEGTVSNLKLVAYIPHVLACAKSSVLKIRQLAAKAMVPLISPEHYVQHLESMLELLCDQTVKRNYIHGILLQLIKLLDAKPDDLTIDEKTEQRLSKIIANTIWILHQATGNKPCYLLADDYVKVISIILWRFPSLIAKETIKNIQNHLDNLIFTDNLPKITSGREICISNALYLYLIILNINDHRNIHELVFKGLSHKNYEIVLATLNYLLILHKKLEIDGKLQEHLSKKALPNALDLITKETRYIELLCNINNSTKYLECIQKSLKLLTLENNTEKYIVGTIILNHHLDIDDKIIIDTLINSVDKEQDNLTHIYLESLSKFVTRKLKDKGLKPLQLLQVLRVIYGCSSSDNSDETRTVVVWFLEQNFEELLNLDLNGLSEEDQFEFKSTLYATLITTLEDDDLSLRQRTSNTINHNTNVIPSRSAEILLDSIDDIALYVVIALLDFRSEVCITDDGNDECRVFDQNERYNIFLEETIWTNECARKIKERYRSKENIIHDVLNIIHRSEYERTFKSLCGRNIVLFEKMCNNDTLNMDLTNPKMYLFVKSLRDLEICSDKLSFVFLKKVK